MGVNGGHARGGGGGGLSRWSTAAPDQLRLKEHQTQEDLWAGAVALMEGKKTENFFRALLAVMRDLLASHKNAKQMPFPLIFKDIAQFLMFW